MIFEFCYDDRWVEGVIREALNEFRNYLAPTNLTPAMATNWCVLHSETSRVCTMHNKTS